MATGIGDALRDARRRQGCTLADASAETRVRETYLAALEQEEFAALGGHVYARGFLTSYAKYLRLDPAPLLDAYAQAYQRPQPGPRHGGDPQVRGTLPRPAAERPPRAVVLVGIVVVVVLALLLLTFLGGDEAGAAAVAVGWCA